MKLREGLALRTLAASLLLGLAATLAVSYLALWWGVEWALGRSAPILSETLLALHGDACRASSNDWTLELPEDVVVEGFDADRARAFAEKQPDPELLARMERGEAQPTAIYFPLFNGRPWAGATLLRVADAGPCSLLEFRWRRT